MTVVLKTSFNSSNTAGGKEADDDLINLSDKLCASSTFFFLHVIIFPDA